MAEERRNQRPSQGSGGGSRSGGPRSGKPASGGRGRPAASGGGRPDRSGSGRPQKAGPGGSGGSGGSSRSSERSDRFEPRSEDRRDRRTGGGRPERGSRPERSDRGDRPGRKQDWKRPTDKQVDRTQEQARYDGPDLPEHITGKELDRAITAQLKGLPEKLASRVARHLAAAGSLIDDDPETAYQHTLAARARAPRLAVVREATGEAAYAAGHYAEALAELRAAKRMNGQTAYLPIMADCHRALGHPDQALKLAKSPSVANFAPEAKAEMTIVEAGARRDMGQLDAALRTLELAPLTSKNRSSWVVRLRYAYADTLEAAGRLNDALTWFHRTHAVDSDEITDAAARADALEKRIPQE
ncbi:tetratricopeptide repeat protein [Nocardioides marmotae]|uniref:tetratricopeptide repeat protein n=1 Tax=Nocardioides marmotae TaxID=2663857 RepID=UPI001326D0E1|nr:tetratricopeptide repeat protein [Nocardioides marmotae]MBC9735218.1 tetratricopeptide repeat protein [Nocardioides marmotae]MTB86318.1 tetratricopeptide repeat protein [Nocardioides marmotae]